MLTDHLNGNLSDDSPDSDSDTESVTSLSSDEIEGYFQTKHGRRFHSHGTVPYPLPADGLEMQRLNQMHEAVKLIFNGSNYCERVGQILHAPMDERMRIVDLGTGSGIWVDEMATEFPNLRFYGVDIVPTATQSPDPNVQYEVSKLERTGLRDGYFHFVHMRETSLGITSFSRVVGEVRRILRPGGYFYAAEWLRNLTMADGSDLQIHAPRAAEFFRVVNLCLSWRNVMPDPEGQLLVGALQQSHQFEVIQTRYDISLGGPGALGLIFGNAFKEYADALKYLLIESGYPVGNAEQLVAGLRTEIDVVPGLTAVYCTILARKLV